MNNKYDFTTSFFAGGFVMVLTPSIINIDYISAFIPFFQEPINLIYSIALYLLFRQNIKDISSIKEWLKIKSSPSQN